MLRPSDRWVSDLTDAELKPVVAALAGEEIERFRISAEDKVPGHYGYSARKAIPTVVYRTTSGKPGRGKLFIKWFNEPGPHEAYHYEHLARYRAPIPRLYGSILTADGREVIFLELLQPVRDLHPFHRFMNDPRRFPEFLRAAARFNAIQPSGEYAARLRNAAFRDFTNWREELGVTLERIWECASKGSLGKPLRKLCDSARGKHSVLLNLAKHAVESLSHKETGLTHGDFYPDSVGTREASGEMLLLDLESVGLDWRFADVARWIGPPDDVRRRCLSRARLAQAYLKEYARCGGRSPSLSRFLEQTRRIWVWQTFAMLNFQLHRSLDGKVDWTEDREKGRQVYRADLGRELQSLLAQVR
jgi:hypothetical protein